MLPATVPHVGQSQTSPSASKRVHLRSQVNRIPEEILAGINTARVTNTTVGNVAHTIQSRVIEDMAANAENVQSQQINRKS